MFAEFTITQKVNYRTRLCSVTFLMTLIISIVTIFLIALFSFEKFDFSNEIGHTLTNIEIDYDGRYSALIDTGSNVIVYPNLNTDVYIVSTWENKIKEHMLDIGFDMYGVSTLEQLDLTYYLSIKEREIINVYYEDYLQHQLKNLDRGKRLTLYCRLAFVQNYPVQISKTPRSLIVESKDFIPLNYKAGLPFRTNLQCNNVIEKTTSNHIEVRIKLFKNQVYEVEYEVDAFRLIRLKWKQVFAAGIIFFYLARKTILYLSETKILDVTKSEEVAD